MRIGNSNFWNKTIVMENDNSTIYNSSLTGPDVESAAVAGDNISIEKGNTILGLYTIESDAFVGGFGRVFRVYHTGWKVDLAMKQPHREKFITEGDKQLFTNECKHWIDLGLHPHIVSCYYVREIDGIPSIFAEWMDGGSLKDAIKKETLYEGSEKEALERILDISIQFARGLHYAHEQGLIHQDVKPDNLLLTGDGKAKVLVAKVSDFGIAGARAMIADANTSASESGVIVTNGNAYTPAYCSPEQKQGGGLTRRTDIWSWAVSALEMFLGDRHWLDGTVAGMACEEYYEMDMRVPMPDTMKDLLRWCFKIDEAERPHDFGVVEAELLKIYQTEIGKIYSRPEPKAASLTADSLNNQALSYLDLGETEEAERCWEEALAITPNHGESLYNRCVYLLKNKRISDTEALKVMEERPSENTSFNIARIYFAWEDKQNATEYLNRAKQSLGDTDEILQFERRVNALKDEEVHRNYKRLIKGEITGNATDKNSWTFGNTVMAITVSRDGKKILCGEEWGKVILLETETGVVLREFKGHKQRVLSVCLSSDGMLAASGSLDKSVRIWDIESGECIHIFDDPKGRPTSLCFTPDGEKLIAAPFYSESEGIVFIWDRTSKEREQTFNLKCDTEDYLETLTVLDNLTMISLSNRGWIRTWDISSKSCIGTVHLTGNDFYSIHTACFNRDASLIFAYYYFYFNTLKFAFQKRH